MQDLQYAACGFEIVLLGKWIGKKWKKIIFNEFDLMTNGLSVYNGCQSRVSVETCAFEFLHFEFLDIHVWKIFLVSLSWEGLTAFV